MKRQLPRCSATLDDGTRCSRRVSDGSRPPLCHIHQAAAQGQSVSPLTQPLPFEPLEKLRKIASKDSHPQQLQALKVLIELEASAARLAEETEPETVNLDAATPDELAELTAAAQTLVRIKAALRGRPAPVDEDDDDPIIVTPESEPPTGVPDVIAEPEPHFTPIELYPLEKAKWAAAGVTEVNGVPAHDFGDEHAARIVNLEISYDDAVRDHAAALQHDRQMVTALNEQERRKHERGE